MIDFRKILEPKNRVILLDCIQFLINLILMTILARLFASFFRGARDDSTLKALVVVFLFGLCFLSPAGAILKRRGAHERDPELGADAVGCMWLPYFLSQLMFLIFVGVMFAEVREEVYGKSSDKLFAPLFVGIPLAAVFNTLIFFFYFMKPKHEPVFKFLRRPQIETLGDVCLFLNLIGYQVFWLYLMSELPSDYKGIFDRVFMFLFTAAFIYIPPRLFYLIENKERPRVWLVMLIANLPIIIRLLFF